MEMVKRIAALMAFATLVACSDGPENTVSANPAAAANDSVFSETTADDPMNPGGIDDSIGTQIP